MSIPAGSSAALAVAPMYVNPRTAVFVLPDQPWARRVSGVYSNELTNRNPERAHAVLTEKAGGGHLVSVRAPLANRTGWLSCVVSSQPVGGVRQRLASTTCHARNLPTSFTVSEPPIPELCSVGTVAFLVCVGCRHIRRHTQPTTLRKYRSRTRRALPSPHGTSL